MTPSPLVPRSLPFLIYRPRLVDKGAIKHHMNFKRRLFPACGNRTFFDDCRAVWSDLNQYECPAFREAFLLGREPATCCT